MTNFSIQAPATIGFVGLGNMGYPMASRLAKAGYTLIVSDLNADALKRFCNETGASSAPDLASMGEAARVVITMLPEGNAVRQVLMGGVADEEGVVAALAKGSVVIDMSSCSPVETRALAAELSELGIAMVDAPVSGGVVKAIDGSLAIMAGGDKETIESCRPLLACLGKLFLTGGPGSGHAMKAMNNYLSAATVAITAEAVLTGEKFGLDPATMVDIINASTGRSNSSEHKFPTFILPRTYNSGFFLGLMAKDLRFAKSLADSMETPHELLDLISDMWNKAETQLGFKADNTEVYRYLESLMDKG